MRDFPPGVGLCPTSAYRGTIMMHSDQPHDLERQIEFDFLRATEIAALNTLQWLGKGQKELADAAACDAIRGMFDLVDMRGEITIGEGIKDEAPGLFKGEKVGTWREGSPRFDIALDPIDGTTNVAKGMPNSLSCIAAAQADDGDGTRLLDIPAFYMKKLAYPLQVRKAWFADPKLPIDIDAPVDEVIKATARILGKEVRDVMVCVLNRPRNEPFVEEIRRTGAALRMIQDGDIASALAPAMQTSDIDLYMGIGGTPEAVLAAAGLRCLGGGMRAKIWPRDEAERQQLIDIGWGDRLDRQFMSRDLAGGDNIVFVATGISTSPLLAGVRVRGTVATTHSVIMRAKSGTVRFVEAHHDLDRKTIHLRSRRAEAKV
jgi:fructose-1,6-bisphosphatase II